MARVAAARTTARLILRRFFEAGFQRCDRGRAAKALPGVQARFGFRAVGVMVNPETAFRQGAPADTEEVESVRPRCGLPDNPGRGRKRSWTGRRTSPGCATSGCRFPSRGRRSNSPCAPLCTTRPPAHNVDYGETVVADERRGHARAGGVHRIQLLAISNRPLLGDRRSQPHEARGDRLSLSGPGCRSATISRHAAGLAGWRASRPALLRRPFWSRHSTHWSRPRGWIKITPWPVIVSPYHRLKPMGRYRDQATDNVYRARTVSWLGNR